MKKPFFYSTNNHHEKVDFEHALLNGIASNYGLYMISKKDVPKISHSKILKMRKMSYSKIAFEVLKDYMPEIPEKDLKKILNDAYNPKVIPTRIQKITGKTHVMWLTAGPTYSFKDYAARFFGRTLNYFLQERKEKRIVLVATSGDTGGAVADALLGLESIDCIVFFPKESISEEQRRQMTTLQKNVYAFSVNGDFDVCQALVKNLLCDKDFAKETFKDEKIFTSANSISLGRLLPQAVYPFYAYSRTSKDGESMISSIPSGNFGDMMGTVLAKEMGLPISKIICGVNENTEFPDYLSSGEYNVKPSKYSPSSAMIVSHPSNIARLIDFYGGHMYDKRNAEGKVIKQGMIDKKPELSRMRKDIYSISVDNKTHYSTIKKVYDKHKIILDPHGAVGFYALEKFLGEKHDRLSVIYETADPAKFPDDVKKAISVNPKVPEGIIRQQGLPERIYPIDAIPSETENGKTLTSEQISEAKQKIKEIYTTI